MADDDYNNNNLNNDDDNYDYDFRVPTASSIYPRATREETLSALLDANEFRPFHKRLPAEILLLVNDELHPPNPVHEEICSIWMVDTEFKRPPYYGQSPQDEYYYIHRSISAADLLYRIRCLFPNVPVRSEGQDGYKSIWTAAVQHKQSGINFQVSEHKGGATMTATWGEMLYDRPPDSDDYGRATPPIPQSKEEAENVFITDALRLLNTLFGTRDGRRFIYYHPAADADYPTADERFLAVPSLNLMERVENENWMPYSRW